MVARFSASGLALMGVPLYLGPVLAGWASAPAWVYLVIVILFFGMQVLRNLAPQSDLPPVVSVLLLLAVQAAVVGIAWGVGALLGLATGRLALPLWIPPALTALGAVVGLLRYRHTPSTAEMEAVLDDALTALEGGPAPDWADRTSGPVEDAVQDALDSLWRLPEDARVHDIDPIVQRLEQEVGHKGFHGLLAETGEGSPVVDRALLRYLASPAVRLALIDDRQLGFLHELILETGSDAVLGEYAMLLDTLLDEDTPASELPALALLTATAERFPPLATCLPALAARKEGA